MKTIVAVVSAGLGNRLMGLMACLVIAKKNNAQVLVVWPEGQDCNISFSRLFDINNSLIRPLDKKTAERLTCGPLCKMDPSGPKAKSLPDSNIVPGFPELDKKITEVNYFQGDNKNPLIVDDLKNEDTVFLWPYNFIATESYTRQELVKEVSSLFWELSPSEQVLKRVADFERENNHVIEYCTLHVRRPYTHRKAPELELRKHSSAITSDDEYLEFAELIINHYGEKLFLCSNDPQIEMKAKERFGDSILQFDKVSTMNNDPLAIIDALAEMIIISKSIHTFASSSFSSFGVNIGENPLGYTWISGPQSFEKARSNLMESGVQKR